MGELNGALLIDKPEGITSFGVIEKLQRGLRERTGLKRRELPSMGHGGTLDPFATGLLLVCVGRAVKLARYFLGSDKSYEAVLRFGETTVPGDPTEPVSERSEVIPASLEEIQAAASKMASAPYLQTPPMHSAKKKDGKPLYELARAGIEIEREPKVCTLYRFDVLDYAPPRARFGVDCSSGTYVRTIAQDLARAMGTVGMLDSLRRTASGPFRVASACELEAILAHAGTWDQLPCWIPFDRLLEGFARVDAAPDEALAIVRGRQNVLFNLLKRAEPRVAGTYAEPYLAIYSGSRLLAVARNEAGVWSLERVFPE